mmetsp:Transcript_20405/g.35206  ORF Transcript_20405/g.35206 Transcript_20405/m.35206 type:complete len:183 (+) Transcript_20405:387-935(+)
MNRTQFCVITLLGCFLLVSIIVFTIFQFLLPFLWIPVVLVIVIIFIIAFCPRNRQQGGAGRGLWALRDINDEEAQCSKPQVPLGLAKEQLEIYCPESIQPDIIDPETCCVCLDEISPGCRKRVLICGHQFHSMCIVRWLVMHSTCPLCSTNIKELSCVEVDVVVRLGEPEPARNERRWWRFS